MTRPRWLPDVPGLAIRLERCRSCDALVMRALDAPVAGIDTRCDPVPLDTLGELSALVQRRRTFDAVPMGRHCELVHRDLWRIEHRRHPVVAEHRCPGPVPGSALRFRPRRPAPATDDTPPF
ncbi:hypothetical protein ACGFNU_01940 [Spirillospora sp. NPDC048911]|uniref:hypothetical protein n=1 Tax=Spirillospora sp. NPDC048911 TaxID=3364527 RepID=UPI00371F516A